MPWRAHHSFFRFHTALVQKVIPFQFAFRQIEVGLQLLNGQPIVERSLVDRQCWNSTPCGKKERDAGKWIGIILG